MNNNPHVAIVGASGAVGVEMIRTLERRNFPVEVLAFACFQALSWQVAEFP